MNLVIVAATAFVLRYWILVPLIDTSPVSMSPTLSENNFILLVLMMVVLGAAGNIINDYFDVRVDRINKPDRVLIDRTVKRRVAMAAHITLNIIGVLIGFYLSWKVGNLLLAAIPLFVAGSLWYYSVTFKKQFLIGNVVVALMVALIPILVGLFELPALFNTYYPDLLAFTERYESGYGPEAFFISLWIWILAYAVYAFVVTLVREVQKDMQDIDGDESGLYRTLPIVWGVKGAKQFVAALLVLVLASLIWLQWYLLEGQENWIYMVFNLCLTLPLTLSLIITLKGNSSTSFGRASTMVKLSILGMLVVTWIFGQLIQGAL